MKNLSYRNTAPYGQALARGRAIQAAGPKAVDTSATGIEAAFYRDQMENKIRLGYLSLQKDMFDQGMEEKERQFDIGLSEQKRQFGSQLHFAGDVFKYARRQNNRAELLGMANIGISIGMGYLQYKQARRQIEIQKQIEAMLSYANQKQSKVETNPRFGSPMSFGLLSE